MTGRFSLTQSGSGPPHDYYEGSNFICINVALKLTGVGLLGNNRAAENQVFRETPNYGL